MNIRLLIAALADVDYSDLSLEEALADAQAISMEQAYVIVETEFSSWMFVKGEELC